MSSLDLAVAGQPLFNTSAPCFRRRGFLGQSGSEWRVSRSQDPSDPLPPAEGSFVDKLQIGV